MKTPSAEAPTVLVVGAGPTGLAAAMGLAKLGVDVRIIDKAAQRSDKSKALGVQAGTLLCLEAALGPSLPQQMVHAGRRVTDAWLHFDDAAPAHVPLDGIPPPFPFVLVLEQSETERLFEEHLRSLSVGVERRVELLSAEQHGDVVLSRLQHATGEVEEVRSAFVLGCDGAHSALRRQLGVPFQGGAYEGTFILGDVALDWPWPYDSIRAFFSREGALACFPMKGEHRYRVVLIPKSPGAGRDSPDLGLDELQPILSRLSGGRAVAREPTWLTRFRIHHRMVASLQQGRLFLAGDAAHIHSPIGGQGMNTGIQDALNLAFKLARVSRGAPFEALAAYEKERLPVARDVLRGTDRAFSLVLLAENPAWAWARRTLLPRLVRLPAIRRRVSLAVSQMAIAKDEVARYRPP